MCVWLCLSLCAIVRMRFFLLSILLVGLLLVPAQCMYFELKEGQRRCFIEEVPADSLVMASYLSTDYHQMQGISNGYTEAVHTVVNINVQDPNKKLLMNHPTTDVGRFAFTSTVGGEHIICLETSTANLYGKVRTFRFSLKLDYGENAIDYNDLAKAEHLSAIEVEVRKLNEKIRSIRSEQEYQRRSEEAFRDTSESTNASVMWYAVFQTVLLCVAAGYQVMHLKGFFKAKKLA